MNSHIDPEDLALFALQFLPAEQSAEIRRHLDTCPECREQLAEIQGDLAVYAMTSEMHSPPAAARDHLLQQVARERRPETARARSTEAARGATDIGRRDSLLSADGRDADRRYPDLPAGNYAEAVEPVRRQPSVITRVLPWAGWAVAAALALTVGQAWHQRDTSRNEVESVNHQMALLTSQTSEARRLLDTLNDPTAQRVTLTLSKQTPVPQGKATYVPQRGALVFVANNMEPLQPSKTYELWIIPTGGQDPIPAGTFHPDAQGNASVILPKLPEGVQAKAFGITVENEGGSKSPTMPIIMAGAAG